jgi:hypothetical protein
MLTPLAAYCVGLLCGGLLVSAVRLERLRSAVREDVGLSFADTLDLRTYRVVGVAYLSVRMLRRMGVLDEMYTTRDEKRWVSDVEEMAIELGLGLDCDGAGTS